MSRISLREVSTRTPQSHEQYVALHHQRSTYAAASLARPVCGERQRVNNPFGEVDRNQKYDYDDPRREDGQAARQHREGAVRPRVGADHIRFAMIPRSIQGDGCVN
jgi:hypothetical protein